MLYTFITVSRMMIMTRCLRSGRIILRKPWDLLVGLLVIMTYGSMRCLLRLFSRAVDSGTSGTQTNKHTNQRYLMPLHSSISFILWLIFRFPAAAQSGGGQGSGQGSGGHFRNDGDDDLYQWSRSTILDQPNTWCVQQGEKRLNSLAIGICTLWLLIVKNNHIFMFFFVCFFSHSDRDYSK